MNKSVYSLVLDDAIVEAIDDIAYAKNSSRSNIINQILAEHIEYLTPRKRMQNIFECMEELFSLENNFKFLNQPSDAMISIKSALKYKYKPTIKYGIEIFDDYDDILGELKVMFRTQSRQLIDDLTEFFIFWANLENKYVAKFFPNGKIKYTISEGRFTRSILNPSKLYSISEEETGKAISDYIKMFDNIIKIYFANIEYSGICKEKCERAYVDYLNGIKTII